MPTYDIGKTLLVFDPAVALGTVGGGLISGAGTYISTPVPMAGRRTAGFIVTTTDGGALAGTLTVEGINDTPVEILTGSGQGWITHAGITIPPISGATTFTILVNMDDGRFDQIRLKFVRSAGVGTIKSRCAVGG